MNKKALIKDLNEVYNLVSDHDITEAMERLDFVISEVKQLHIPVVSVSFIDQVKQQIEYHKEQETNRSKVKDYSQAIYHDNRRGALEDLLLWIKLNER